MSVALLRLLAFAVDLVIQPGAFAPGPDKAHWLAVMRLQPAVAGNVVASGMQLIEKKRAPLFARKVMDRHRDGDLYDEVAHAIEFEPGGLLEGIYKDEAKSLVNSIHHQGIKELASCLNVEAKAPDGLVEAFSHKDTSSANIHVTNSDGRGNFGKSPALIRLGGLFSLLSPARRQSGEAWQVRLDQRR